MTLKGKFYRSIRPVLPAIARDLIELGFGKEGYLVRTGWMRSRKTKFAVDAAGDPLPWYTYPAIRFLDDRVSKKLSVFEFGTGYSTLWWSGRASEVIACEHDQAWLERISQSLPSNVKILHRSLHEGYEHAAVDTERKFNVIVIDGRRRVRCARSAVRALTEDGIFIWDNSDRAWYGEGYDLLKSKNFKRMDFWGLGPLNMQEWCTSIFYRDKNCLNI